MTRRFIRCAIFVCAFSCQAAFNASNVKAQAEPAAPLPQIAPLEPAAAIESFVVQDGFKLQLLAAEPMVTDPVAGVYDEFGRLFVVEMNDYPYTDKTTDIPNRERNSDILIGKVRLLEDTDDDGVFDKSTIFAGDLSWPTGIAVYQGGVFVAATPDLWYLKDADGDGVSDVRSKVFTGFRKFNIQAVMNNLIWGLDHRIYGAGGTNGGTITSLGEPNREKVVIRRNDFRFDPRTEVFELLSGGARFGNTFDDWGHRFICNIRNPIQHVLLPQHYLERNSNLPVSTTLNDVAAAGDQIRVYRSSPPEPWRVVNAERLTTQGDPRIPRSEKNAAGFMTSACGVTVYRGDAYPVEFRQQVFLAEPSGNLVHRQKLTVAGVTFQSERIDQESEFLASKDNWFRPVNFVHAPDGTLHLFDMYRETIEHPWSMPDDLKAMLDLENGRDRGRIYRIAPPQFHRRPTPKLGAATMEELVTYLDHPNVWHRETAHRLIFERQDPRAVNLLRQLWRQADRPVTRLHILWSLHGLEQLTDADLLSALADSAAPIRQQAVLLAERHLEQFDSMGLRNAVLRLAEDDDTGVRFQVALTLGNLVDPNRIAALEKMARRDADDPWITVAVLSSSVELAPKLLGKLLVDEDFASDPLRRTLLTRMAQLVGTRNQPDEIREIGDRLARLPETPQGQSAQLAMLLALDDGVRRTGVDLETVWKDVPTANAMLARHLNIARVSAVDHERTPAEQIAALRVVACGSWGLIDEIAFRLLELKQPQEVQVAAIRTIAVYHRDDLAARLLAGFTGATPPVQHEIVEALANHPQRLPSLLDALANGKISASQITPIRKMLLLSHADETIRHRAVQLIGNDRSTPRQSVVRDYQVALKTVGNGTRGRKVFQRDCATCHRLGDQGHEVGPNLATIRHRRADEILVQILDPNREVGPNFMQYAVALDDGRVLTGMIAEESASSITLRRADRKQDEILRNNIAEIAGTGLSLMPDGLEKKITLEEMADLLAFLQGK